MASSKTKTLDADIEHFYFRMDLAINPPLPDSKAKAGKNDFFALKQKKDEDVKVVNGEIVVVSNNITSVEQSSDPSQYFYNYSDFKKAIATVGALASGAGSSLDGQVVVKDGNTGRYFRLKVVAGSVTVEAANLGWPDGTQTPWPDGDGA